MPAADVPPALVRPVDGALRRTFAYDAADPFRRGARRTVRFVTGTGSVVVAPCPGRVSFAGPTPGEADGGRGRAVTVRCGAWSVVVGGLRSTTVRSGRTVAARVVVGVAAGSMTLSVRRTADPFGYVDPAALLRRRDPGPTSPVVPAPSRRAPRPLMAPRPLAVPRPVAPVVAPRPVVPRVGVPGAVTPPARPTAAPHPGSAPVRPPAAGAPGPPALVWVGLGVAALGLPVAGGVARRRRRPAPTAGRLTVMGRR